jgi:hypothetical protein
VLALLGSLGCGGGSAVGQEGGDESGETSIGESETGTTGPSEPWGEPTDPCEGVDCSGHGTCVANGKVASCECEEGFWATQYECIACSPVGDDHVYDIDVPMILMEPQVTVAGLPPPMFGYADLSFETESDRVLVAHLPDPPPSTLAMIPGVYDLHFGRSTFHADNPLPRYNTVVWSARAIDEPGDLIIDVPIVTVTVTLTVNGEMPEPNDDWQYFAVDPATGDSESFEQNGILTGTYDMMFSGEGSIVPSNQDAVLDRNVVIAQSGHIAVDVPAIDQSGVLTVGGQVLGGSPDDPETDAMVYLSNPDLGRVQLISPVVGGDYSVRLMPGTYDILYEQEHPLVGVPGVPGLPDNTYAIIPAGLVITTDQATTDIDIPVVNRSGSLTVNGATVAANEWGAKLYYVNRTTGDRVLIRDFAWGQYAMEIIPGVYDLVFDGDPEYPRASLPHNDYAVLETDVVVDQSGNFDIDIPMITVSGSVTVNGAPAGEPGYANILFRQIGGGSTNAADVGEGAYSVNLIPGTYDIVYDLGWLGNSPDLPINEHSTVSTQVEFDSSMVFDIDIPAVVLTGTMTINGEMVQGGELELHTSYGHDFLLGTGMSPYSAMVIPGTYAVAYSHGDAAPGVTVPRNYQAMLDCIVIPP